MGRIIESNKVSVAGTILGEFEYNHEIFGEKFYSGTLEVPRLSGYVDYVPILVSERIIDTNEVWDGLFVSINGSFRSHNNVGQRGLYLSVFVNEINKLIDPLYENCIELDGYVCKEPIYRKTPLGHEIADILLAVNRPYGKSDYIPCIAWGRNAILLENIEIGTHLKIKGRVQSREYRKKLSDTKAETRTAFEVSVSKLEVVEDEN